MRTNDVIEGGQRGTRINELDPSCWLGISSQQAGTTGRLRKKGDHHQEETDVQVEKVEEDIPTEYKSALKKAESYSKTMSMSKAGVYDQLTSEYGEKFTAEAAQYAIDNMEADWKQNALKKAESYQEKMSMSKAAIYDQLISEYGEKFTAEEAQYAVDNLE